jgi:hypothetical protein
VGNVQGGIPAAEFSVPLAYYGRYRGTDKPECSEERNYPFVFFLRQDMSKEALKQRYGSGSRFGTVYRKRLERLVRERWLLPEDAQRMQAKAIEDARRLF